MSQCNFCTNKQIIKKAKQSGNSVTHLKETKYGLGGINVYVHPKNINIKKLPAKEREKYFKVWFMALGSHCEC